MEIKRLLLVFLLVGCGRTWRREEARVLEASYDEGIFTADYDVRWECENHGIHVESGDYGFARDVWGMYGRDSFVVEFASKSNHRIPDMQREHQALPSHKMPYKKEEDKSSKWDTD
jgi:hypothetical protein